MSPRQKDVLCWIAATAIVLLMLLACVQIVDPVTGEGWNPILWVVQMAFGAWLLICAAYWLCYYAIYVPVRWLVRLFRPDPCAGYPAWFRRHFPNSLRRRAGR